MRPWPCALGPVQHGPGPRGWSWGRAAAAAVLANCAVLTAVAYQEDSVEQTALVWPPTTRHSRGGEAVTIDPCGFTYRDASVGTSDVQRAIDL